MLTSREADDPDVQELLVRQSLLELLPPVVGTARAARVVNLLLPLPQQQRRSDAALLLHCTYVLWWLLTEEERDQRRVASRSTRTQEHRGDWRWLLVWRSAPKRFRHGLRRLEWLEAGANGRMSAETVWILLPRIVNDAAVVCCTCCPICELSRI